VWRASQYLHVGATDIAGPVVREESDDARIEGAHRDAALSCRMNALADRFAAVRVLVLVVAVCSLRTCSVRGEADPSKILHNANGVALDACLVARAAERSALERVPTAAERATAVGLITGPDQAPLDLDTYIQLVGFLARAGFAERGDRILGPGCLAVMTRLLSVPPSDDPFGDCTSEAAMYRYKRFVEHMIRSVLSDEEIAMPVDDDDPAIAVATMVIAMVRPTRPVVPPRATLLWIATASLDARYAYQRSGLEDVSAFRRLVEERGIDRMDSVDRINLV
jgi:hypothetical protein